MPPAARILQASSVHPQPDSSEPISVDSDLVVILAALLCALICVVGLALVARCSWLRRRSPGGSGGARDSEAFPAPPPPSCGLKKAALKALPKVSYDAAAAVAGAEAGVPRLSDCAICLAEFAGGDEVRILPQCGHGFHAACVDTWLGSHSSCPSCRRVLVLTAAVPAPAAAPQPARCHRCGASSTDAATSAAECGAKVRADSDPDRFLP